MWAVSTLHPPSVSVSLLFPSFPSCLSVSYHHHHHIHGKRSDSASCSAITSSNPHPSVCISASLIAPETQSNGQGMHTGVQLTGSPLSLSWYTFNICPLSQALCGPFCSPLHCFLSPLPLAASKSEWAACPNSWESRLLPRCSHRRSQHQQTQCGWGSATELPHVVHPAHLPIPCGEEWQGRKSVPLDHYFTSVNKLPCHIYTTKQWTLILIILFHSIV